ncbi:unnamed protein product [Staurois parvus]|uniref:Ig-like domain-containing protein n=1 Tax=Staurois parvus TaxID=386267 RepID=A0ABN9FNV7_9NEOB|nr:unnamed protein product [Staurois parvus]
MTQTPDSISVSPGQTITITCTSSTSLTDSSYSYLAWYQQKPQQPPKLLIYDASTRQSNRHTGVPDRFTGRSDGSPYTRYTLTITAVTEDDEGGYLCQQYNSWSHSDTEPYKNLLPLL